MWLIEGGRLTLLDRDLDASLSVGTGETEPFLGGNISPVILELIDLLALLDRDFETSLSIGIGEAGSTLAGVISASLCPAPLPFRKVIEDVSPSIVLLAASPTG